MVNTHSRSAVLAFLTFSCGRVKITVHEVKARLIEQVETECQKIQCLTRIVLRLKRFAPVLLSILAVSLFTVSCSLKKLVFTAHEVHFLSFKTNESLCQIIITRKDLALSTKTNQLSSSKSVLMEVRFVTAATRGFFFSRSSRSRLRRSISPQKTEKKPSGT